MVFSNKDLKQLRAAVLQLSWDIRNVAGFEQPGDESWPTAHPGGTGFVGFFSHRDRVVPSKCFDKAAPCQVGQGTC